MKNCEGCGADIKNGILCSDCEEEELDEELEVSAGEPKDL